MQEMMQLYSCPEAIRQHAQLGNKGFGEPLLFDNTYFRTLLAKPWADPTNEMG